MSFACFISTRVHSLYTIYIQSPVMAPFFLPERSEERRKNGARTGLYTYKALLLK